VAPLVSTELLAGMLGQPGLAVLDATYYLPDEGKDGRALFNAAHIPGAGFFDVDEIADQTSGLPHMLPSPAAFSAAAGGLGVGTGAPVIVYDQRGIFSAARVWWMFRVFGHDNVAVLDGGLPKWQAEGRAVTDAISAPAPQTFDATFRPEKVRTLAQMRDNLASGEAVMLDARSAGRFSGTVPEPRAGMKSGHIPGSKSLPFATLLEAGARFLPPPGWMARGR
jgi:thiosulfate/3-mercaptopyruvate sulfurtransferase